MPYLKTILMSILHPIDTINNYRCGDKNHKVENNKDIHIKIKQ